MDLELELMIWRKRNRELAREMEDFLRDLASRGCKICENNGGYTHHSETGNVCKHMIDLRYKKFKERIASEIGFVSELNRWENLIRLASYRK